MKIQKYPDGASYVSINLDNERPYECSWKLNTYEDLWQLNQFVDACNSDGFYPTVTIPNLIDAQADRRFNPGESSGLKLVCNFLNDMQADFKIFHPHNPEVVEALINDVEIIDNRLFIQGVLNNIAGPDKDFDFNFLDNFILMSSDAGGFKPLMKLCDQINWKGETYSASKARTIEGMKQIIDIEDFGGKDILIIDDLCVYGGTFKGLASMLKKRNCGKLYLAVSHITVSHLGQDPVTSYFDKVFTTNSKYDKYTAAYKGKEGGGLLTQPENLQIINLF